MSDVAYRSFLVRTWEHGDASIRVSIEAVQTGHRVELRGDPARRVLELLEDALAVGQTVDRSGSWRGGLGEPRTEPHGQER